jgi:hypothetical protein
LQGRHAVLVHIPPQSIPVISGETEAVAPSNPSCYAIWPTCGHNCSNVLPCTRVTTRKYFPGPSSCETVRRTAGALTTIERVHSMARASSRGPIPQPTGFRRGRSDSRGVLHRTGVLAPWGGVPKNSLRVDGYENTWKLTDETDA